MSRAARFHHTRALMTRILQEDDRPRVFLFGAPLTMPESTESPGVPDVGTMIGLVVDLLKRDAEDAVNEIRALVASGDLGAAYREGFTQIQGWFGLERANQLVRDAVLRARTQPSALDRGARVHDGAWHLRPSVRALGELLAKSSRFTPVLTTNFDPLIEVSVRRAGGSCFRTVLDVDGSITRASGDGVHVVYLHGYWSHGDTLHTSVQLRADRPRLANSLKALLAKRTLVVLGYSGWDDVMVRTLKEVVESQDEYPEILWAFRETDHEKLRNGYANLFSCLAEGYDRGRVQYYSGVDMHALLVDLGQHPSAPATPASIVRATSSANAETVAIHLTATSEFERGEKEARTKAFLLLRSRERGVQAEISVVHAARATLSKRRLELEKRKVRTDDEEAEYRHMFVLADHLDRVVPLMERAIHLLQGSPLVKGVLLSDENLGKYIVGLRNLLFSRGTPVLWGREFANPEWLPARSHEWWLWFSSSSGPRMCTSIDVSDGDVKRRETELLDDRGERVLPINTALDVYYLRVDTFWLTVLPNVAYQLLTNGPNKPDFGHQAWHLENWFACPVPPEGATGLTMDQVHARRASSWR